MEHQILSFKREKLEAEARMYYRQLSGMYCSSGNCGDEFPFGSEEQFVRNYVVERLEYRNKPKD